MDDTNKLESIDLTVHADAGFSVLEPEANAVQGYLQNGYFIPLLNFNANDVITNTPGITIFRAPFLSQVQ